MLRPAIPFAMLVTIFSAVTSHADVPISRERTPAPDLSQALNRGAKSAQVFDAADSASARIAGTFESSADPTGAITLTFHPGGIIEVRSLGRWRSIGYFRDGTFAGVIQPVDTRGMPTAVPSGMLQFTAAGDSSISAQVSTRLDDAIGAPETWTRRNPQQVILEDRPRDPSMPAYGEYVYIEELPEAIIKVPPKFPDDARRSNIEGTVLVQALVGADGRVKDTKIVKSIPGLDEAAIAAVVQWEFKPAKAKGKPQAVWVAIPVKFTLK